MVFFLSFFNSLTADLSHAVSIWLFFACHKITATIWAGPIWSTRGWTCKCAGIRKDIKKKDLPQGRGDVCVCERVEACDGCCNLLSPASHSYYSCRYGAQGFIDTGNKTQAGRTPVCVYVCVQDCVCVCACQIASYLVPLCVHVCACSFIFLPM